MCLSAAAANALAVILHNVGVYATILFDQRHTPKGFPAAAWHARREVGPGKRIHVERHRKW